MGGGGADEVAGGHRMHDYTVTMHNDASRRAGGPGTPARAGGRLRESGARCRYLATPLARFETALVAPERKRAAIRYQ